MAVGEECGGEPIRGDWLQVELLVLREVDECEEALDLAERPLGVDAARGAGDVVGLAGFDTTSLSLERDVQRRVAVHVAAVAEDAKAATEVAAHAGEQARLAEHILVVDPALERPPHPHQDAVRADKALVHHAVCAMIAVVDGALSREPIALNRVERPAAALEDAIDEENDVLQRYSFLADLLGELGRERFDAPRVHL